MKRTNDSSDCTHNRKLPKLDDPVSDVGSSRSDSEGKKDCDQTDAPSLNVNVNQPIGSTPPYDDTIDAYATDIEDNDNPLDEEHSCASFTSSKPQMSQKNFFSMNPLARTPLTGSHNVHSSLSSARLQCSLKDIIRSDFKMRLREKGMIYTDIAFDAFMHNVYNCVVARHSAIAQEK
eukprot:CAMPEP_0185028528 /NCGR_PEP_ID=MMETSP1103-20130426/14293_1 /TAXON_ID=36769 /ORGANISM="Paraphysomonas bandaiensis, Strain Caron Lab Isolate" /LENGTH=176 /DNA_ID=CAMNT_0027562965 /DNA_START=45 /DNA_END=575 /DNA_ORIENTATION=+